jgi:hypothetical protein
VQKGEKQGIVNKETYRERKERKGGEKNRSSEMKMEKGGKGE